MTATALAPAPAAVEFWAALLTGLKALAADVSANRAPPAATFDPGALAAGLERLNASLPAIAATLREHQGVITGVADLLAALSRAGVPHAADIEAAVLAAPDLLQEAEKWLPWILPFVSGGGPFAAAPRGGPPVTEGDPWRGPQPVDNPSGAIGGPWPSPDP